MLAELLRRRRGAAPRSVARYRERCRSAVRLPQPRETYRVTSGDSVAGVRRLTSRSQAWLRCSDAMTESHAELTALACAGSQKQAIEYSVCPRNAKA